MTKSSGDILYPAGKRTSTTIVLRSFGNSSFLRHACFLLRHSFSPRLAPRTLSQCFLRRWLFWLGRASGSRFGRLARCRLGLLSGGRGSFLRPFLSPLRQAVL